MDLSRKMAPRLGGHYKSPRSLQESSERTPNVLGRWMAMQRAGAQLEHNFMEFHQCWHFLQKLCYTMTLIHTRLSSSGAIARTQ